MTVLPSSESRLPMPVATLLDRLREINPGCHYVAYADLNAGMVLATSASRNMTQEYWEGLCDTAVGLLAGELTQKVNGLLNAQSDDKIYHAILADGDDLGLFVRSIANPADALCCVCAPDVALQEVIDQMQTCLAEIDHDA